MNLSRRTRAFLAVLAAAAVGALVAAVLLTRETEAALSKGPPGVVATGKFRPVIWGTTGSATIVRDRTGHLKLRLSKTFRTQRAPELYVYVARYEGERRTQWTRVAPLRSAWGAQEYDLPAKAATAPGVSVTIFCEKCNKAWGAAALHAARGRALS